MNWGIYIGVMVMLDVFKRRYGIKNIIFFVLTILFLIFLTKIKDVAILFFASYVIACSLNPIADIICKKYEKISRNTAASIVFFGSLFIAFLFLVPIIIVGGQEISSFLNMFPEHFERAKHFFANTPYLSDTNLNDMDWGSVASSVSGVTSNIVSGSITASKEVASALIYFLAGCIIIYYFIADKDTVKKGYLLLFPHSMKKRAEEILESISQKVGGYVLAQLAAITGVGLIVLIGLLLLGVNYALILGLITAIFDLVPIIGPAVAFVIILLAVSKLGALKIGLAILIFAFAQWAENNLIRPYVFGKLLNIHPLIIFFFILVTAQFLGIVGLIFAPAIAATVCVLVEELYIKNIN